MKKKVFWWILIITWMLFIFMQSNKPAVDSSQGSKYITDMINHSIQYVTGYSKAIVSEHLIRKAAHFTEYFILGLLLFQGLKRKDRLAKAALLCIAIGILYSASDEIHQHFIPGRAMMLFDVGVDTSGLIVSVILSWLKDKGTVLASSK